MADDSNLKTPEVGSYHYINFRGGKDSQMIIHISEVGLGPTNATRKVEGKVLDSNGVIAATRGIDSNSNVEFVLQQIGSKVGSEQLKVRESTLRKQFATETRYLAQIDKFFQT